MFSIGFFFQVAADLQKNTFRSDPSNRGRVCNTGTWALTRHPNYFGEILLWWGVFVASTPTFIGSSGWFTIISPLFTMWLLLFLSGIPTAEGENLARYYNAGPENRDAFIRYFNSTSPLIPCPPGLYRAVPLVVKRIFCCEFKMYEYSPPQERSLAADQPGDRDRDSMC
jgi:steroid 5-alpha reductase family enzyme